MACLVVVASLPGVVCQMDLVACVRGVASLHWEGAQGCDHNEVASLPLVVCQIGWLAFYGFCQMACVLVVASLLGVVFCQMDLVACVRGVAPLPWEV
ncbi:hypothetical protein PVL29_006139 [Vitis rotundifolia]|uniref:Uncharacterized protein n=1 Tax=Vitis rotundifolia TaxID=103349 RepID=A0AA39DZ21_VITRO|nr:hypothetical protein PVL29_006139 [Vitis rotundifolia]